MISTRSRGIAALHSLFKTLVTKDNCVLTLNIGENVPGGSAIRSVSSGCLRHSILSEPSRRRPAFLLNHLAFYSVPSETEKKALSGAKDPYSSVELVSQGCMTKSPLDYNGMLTRASINGRLIPDRFLTATAHLIAAASLEDASFVNKLLSRLKNQAYDDRFNAVFDLFTLYVNDHYKAQVEAYREKIQLLDLTKPYMWYPTARALQRKFVYHAGPTNSGKTYSAIQSMIKAESGIYLAPLRLLALEVYDSANASGTYCSLVTGQERRMVPGSSHVSCTIEMASLTTRYDVAVIDEIQMIGDSNRGWAWTRALLGLCANEIHMCGDGSAVGLVKQLLSDTNEELTVHNYERFSPIKIEKPGLKGSWAEIQAGDCVVAFSRKQIFAIKSLIEAETNFRVCLIYGALPPETRRQQARLFNEEGNGYDVLVASDAIGMGLNLNMRRVIFSSMHKIIKLLKVPLTASEIKQMAGRAGRRGTQYPDGYATCFLESDLKPLEDAVAMPLHLLTNPKAGIFPELLHFEAFAMKHANYSFPEILLKFRDEATIDSKFFFCQQPDLEKVATLLEKVPNLSLVDRYTFCNAPIKLMDPNMGAALLNFATLYERKQPVYLNLVIPVGSNYTQEHLEILEKVHAVVSLWIWLSLRFEEHLFPNRKGVMEIHDQLISRLNSGLRLNSTHKDTHTQAKVWREKTEKFTSDLQKLKSGSISSMFNAEVCANAGQKGDSITSTTTKLLDTQEKKSIKNLKKEPKKFQYLTDLEPSIQEYLTAQLLANEHAMEARFHRDRERRDERRRQAEARASYSNNRRHLQTVRFAEIKAKGAKLAKKRELGLMKKNKGSDNLKVKR